VRVQNEFNPEAFSAGNGSRSAFLSDYNLSDSGQPLDDERGVLAEFSMDKVLLGFKSKEAGREIFEDREFISIRIRGQDKSNVVREVTEQDKRRFPRAYAAFKANVTQARVGTPIERLAAVSPTQIYMFKQHNITTVEDLSEVADQYLQNLGPGSRDLQRQAKEFLSNGKVANAELEAKVDEQSAQLKQALELIQQLKQQLNDSTAKPAKKSVDK
jgi:hypothetical protein